MTTETQLPVTQPTTPPVDAPPQPPAPSVAPPAEPPAPPAAPPVAPPAPIAEFEETGDPALDVSLMYAAQQGLNPESPEIVAARAGDFAKLEAYFKGKQAPGWEKQLALAKGAYARVVADVQAKNQSIATAVFSAAGGEAAWKEAAAFVARTATQEQKNQINDALTQGGMVAEAMARLVVGNYRQSVGKSAKSPTNTAPSAPAGDAQLTAREYGRQIEKLRIANKGKDFRQTPEYTALSQARVAARSAGVN